MLNTLLHQSSMQELDLLNPQLDPRISYSGGPKWYHGPDGLLRESAGNYLLWSQDFDNVAWLKDQATVVTNAAVAPDGTLTADLIVPSTTSTTSHRLFQDITSPGAIAYTSTLYAKAGGYRFIRLTHYTSSATVDLADGSVVATGGSPDAFSVTAAENGYWRIEVNKTVVAGTLRTHIAVYATAAQTAYAGDGVSGVYVWGAQLEKSVAATAYKPTTTTAAFEWPIEYDPLTLAPLGRSGWEQRTNRFLWSNDFSNAAWTKANVTVVQGATTGPDGALSAWKFVPDATAANFWLGQPVSVTNGQVETMQAVVAAAEYSTCTLLAVTGTNPNVQFDLVAEAAVGANGATGTIEHIGGGHYLCTMTYTPGATGSVLHRFYDRTPGSRAGDGVSGIYICNLQLEQAGFAGPYIPTNSSQVTRPSELSMVEAIAEKLRFPGQSGTVVLEVRYPSSANKYTFAQIDDGDATLDDDWLFYTNNNFDHFVCRLYPGGAHTGVHIVTPNTNLRMVEAADAAGAITSVNGDVPTIGANGCSQVGMQRVIMGRASSGSGAAGAYIRYMAFYPSKFTAAEVQARAA